MRKLINTIAISIILFLGACSSSEKPAAAGTDTISTQKTASAYTCPMHPEIMSDKPGKYPKCEMTLIKKEKSKKNSSGKMM